MKIAIFAHHYNLHNGHAKAMIETMKLIPHEDITHVKVIAWESLAIKEMFPEGHIDREFVEVPFDWPLPWLVKGIIYHLWTYLYAAFILPKDFIKVGIGTGALCVDVSNVQFVQKQWAQKYFKIIQPNPIKRIYKYLVFAYNIGCEKLLYPKIKLSALSNFVALYLKKNYNIKDENLIINYNSIDPQRFRPLPFDFAYTQAINECPEIINIDFKKPVFLFVGAFERKGLPIVLKNLEKIPGAQLIIIGKGEIAKKFKRPHNYPCAYLPRSKQIEVYFSLADAFYFPTHYEPFGLVILEAYVSGLQLIVPTKNVGAMEVIVADENIFALETTDSSLAPIKKLSYETKIALFNKRTSHLENYRIEKGSEQFWKLLQSCRNAKRL